jgi:hypothetical protein
MRPSNAVPTALHRTKWFLAALLAGVSRLVGACLAGSRRLVMGLRTGAVGLGCRGAALARDPVWRSIRDPLTRVLFGRRTALSVSLLGLGAALSLGTAVAVSATVGYRSLARWLVGTWTGTDPQSTIFVGAAVLVAVAAASAAANDGLVPTTLLVAGPLFGAAITRYGTVVSTYGGERVVSLPDAVAVAAGVAAVGGLAVVAVGYPLGVACRRGVRIVRADLPSPFAD